MTSAVPLWPVAEAVDFPLSDFGKDNKEATLVIESRVAGLVSWLFVDVLPLIQKSFSSRRTFIDIRRRKPSDPLCNPAKLSVLGVSARGTSPWQKCSAASSLARITFRKPQQPLPMPTA